MGAFLHKLIVLPIGVMLLAGLLNVGSSPFSTSQGAHADNSQVLISEAPILEFECNRPFAIVQFSYNNLNGATKGPKEFEDLNKGLNTVITINLWSIGMPITVSYALTGSGGEAWQASVTAIEEVNPTCGLYRSGN